MPRIATPDTSSASVCGSGTVCGFGTVATRPLRASVPPHVPLAFPEPPAKPLQLVPRKSTSPPVRLDRGEKTFELNVGEALFKPTNSV